jgi:uncharacterized protein (TIGR02246 family)
MMHMRTALLTTIILCLASGHLRAGDAVSRISGEISAQLEAWNRGDIPAFVETYAEDCTFVGKNILHGRAQLLARYRKSYASPAAMGKLSFSNLSIRPLDQQVAIATGQWHIDRPMSAGGPVGGIFSLVWQLRSDHWRIVLDHTT